MRVTYVIRNIMTRDIVSVETTASVKEAMDLMVEKEIGSVVVTRNGEMVGFVTERDVLKKCCPNTQCTVMKARDIMSSHLVTIDADAAIGEAANLVAQKKIGRLLVTEKGEIQGIITEKDVMRATLDVFRILSGVSR